ncbi:MAG: T9SS type A sorting domain-containing protein [Crocinitomix sp.]|nr:T9SS type A sorting domain-containing protein [Crocinitomix sp.]
MKNSYLLLFIVTLFVSNASAQTWNNIGPEGGFFKDFVIHPSNSNIIYAGSDDGGGVWKTINGGDSWDLLTGDYPNFTGWHMTMDLEHPDTLYFCELYGRYGILKTTDGGDTFEHLTDGFNFNRDLQTTQLVIYPGDGDTLFASTGEGDDFGRIGNGIFSSYNGGSTWNYAGLQNHSVHCINISATERLLAGTDENGLWFSDDIGVTWELHPDVPDTATVLQIDIMDGVLAISGGANGVYVSFDNGLTFANIGIIGESNFDLAILSTTPNFEIISTGFFHPNHFTSETLLWTAITDPLLEDHILIGIDAVDDLIIAGIFSSTEIIKSTDNGATWNAFVSNPIATEIRSVRVDPNSDHIYTSLQHSYNLSGDRYNKEVLAISEDDGSTWTRTGPLAHGMDLVIHPDDSETLFLGTFAQGLFKTTDGFATWESARAGNKLILDLVIDPENTAEMILSELDIPTITTGVFKSTDGGDTWYNTGDLAATQIVYNSDNDTVFFSTENGIYISDDNGESINPTPAYFGGDVVLSIAYNSPYLYAGTKDGKLFKIDNDGLVEEITGDWNGDGPAEVRNLMYEGNSIIVGLNGAEQDSSHNLSGGVWQSIDNGESWIDLTGNLTNNNIYGNTALAVANNGDLIVGTYGQSLFRTGDVVLASIGNEILEPSIAIFPNPSNGQTRITAASAIEAILITTLDGKIILENKNLDSKQFLLNQSELSAGVYIITMRVNGVNSTHKWVVK